MTLPVRCVSMGRQTLSLYNSKKGYLVKKRDSFFIEEKYGFS